jgi:hypothetical protein
LGKEEETLSPFSKVLIEAKVQQNLARASQTNWTSLVLPMPMSKPIPEEVMAEVTTLSTPKKTNPPKTTISRQMSLQDECVLGLTGSKRRKIAPIPEESSSPRTIATLLTPSSTPARGGKDISPRLPLPMSMVLAGQDAASVSQRAKVLPRSPQSPWPAAQVRLLSRLRRKQHRSLRAMTDESKAAATAPPWIHRFSTAPLLGGRAA